MKRHALYALALLCLLAGSCRAAYDQICVYGTTSRLIEVMIRSSSTGMGLTGVAYGSVNYATWREGAASDAAATCVTMSMGLWADHGWVELDSTNMPGLYQFGIPNSALAAGANAATIQFKITGAIDKTVRIVLVAFDPTTIGANGLVTVGTATGQVNASGGVVPASGNWYTGTPPTVQNIVDGISATVPTGKANAFGTRIPDAVAGAASGLALVGSAVNASQLGGQTVTAGAGITVGAYVGNANHAMNVDASGRVDLGEIYGRAVSDPGGSVTSGAYLGGSGDPYAQINTKIPQVITFASVGGTQMPEVDVRGLLGTAWLTPGTAGTPDVNAKLLGATSQTGRDIGASVLLSSGTGTGQLSLSSGQVTVATNNDKTGYTASTVSDKTGYSLAASQHVIVDSGTITTYTGNTPQTGDSYAIAKSGGTGDLAAIKAVQPAYQPSVASSGKVAATVSSGDGTDAASIKATIGIAGAGLTNLGDTRIANLNAPVGSIPTNPYTGTPPTTQNIVDAISATVPTGKTTAFGARVPDAAGGATNGLALVGSNMGTASSVTGSVGSVTGSVGSVTGSVGGDVGGKVLGGGVSAIAGVGTNANVTQFNGTTNAGTPGYAPLDWAHTSGSAPASGLTAQQTRDAMALSTLVGSPADGSLDAKLAALGSPQQAASAVKLPDYPPTSWGTAVSVQVINPWNPVTQTFTFHPGDDYTVAKNKAILVSVTGDTTDYTGATPTLFLVPSHGGAIPVVGTNTTTGLGVTQVLQFEVPHTVTSRLKTDEQWKGVVSEIFPDGSQVSPVVKGQVILQ